MTFDSRWKNPQGSEPNQLYIWAQDVIKELRKGDYLPATPDAGDIAYDNGTSGLTATNAQAAIDEVEGRVDVLEAIDPGLVLLTSGTISSPQATLSIPLTSYTGYRAIKFLLSSFVPATDDVELWMRFSTDGGANYDATGYSYAANGARDGSTVLQTAVATSANEILVAGNAAANFGASNVAAEGGVDAEITLHNQTGSRWSRARYYSAMTVAASETATLHGAGTREAQQDTDAVQFLFQSGDIASGNWAVYGYA